MFNEIGMYIHIPFCKSKCYYCDFNSYSGLERFIPEYAQALKAELEHYRKILDNYVIRTVFIGGGTPSIINSDYIEDILGFVKSNFNLVSNPEITIEANPGTLNLEKLRVYKKTGINRLSIGLQAWQDRLLMKLGRIHTLEDFLKNYYDARESGFDNINIDLIFGLPEQTAGDWEETLLNVLQLKPEHLSCYSLKIEEGTKFGEDNAAGRLRQVDDDIDREMYYLAKNMLQKSLYKHYEISNFSKPGFKSRHNLIYWKQEEYVGIGAGAHSFLKGERYNNFSDIDKYMALSFSGEFTKEEVHIIDRKEAMSEFVILGLRLLDGVSYDEFYERFNSNLNDIYGKEINALTTRKLLEQKGDILKLTDLGLDLANAVFVEFV